MIILIGSSKGGSGKSTIATNLAAVAVLAGRDVVLLDADSQSTSATWAADREQTNAPPIPCVQVAGNYTAEAKKLAGKHELLLIDAGGKDTQELRAGLGIADLLIAPFRPSQADLDTVFQLSDVISEMQKYNASLKAVALLTMSPTHPANTEIKEARDYLAKHMTVLDCLTHDRKAYRDALSKGLGVVEHTDKKAKNEVNKLYRVITNGKR